VTSGAQVHCTATLRSIGAFLFYPPLVSWAPGGVATRLGNLVSSSSLASTLRSEALS
jgi:hypothetical protein